MSEYIPVGSRVVVPTMQGEYTGEVMAFRDTHLAEFNPEQEVVTKNDLNIPIKGTPLDPMRIITVYTVKLDNPTDYPGDVLDGMITTWKFIRLANDN